MSGDVLDVTGGSTESGTLIQQWSSDGFPQQQWQVVSVRGEVYAIVNNLTGEALDVQGSSTDAGALIQQSAYLGKQSQQWEIISVGSGYYEILNSATAWFSMSSVCLRPMERAFSSTIIGAGRTSSGRSLRL